MSGIKAQPHFTLFSLIDLNWQLDPCRTELKNTSVCLFLHAQFSRILFFMCVETVSRLTCILCSRCWWAYYKYIYTLLLLLPITMHSLPFLPCSPFWDMPTSRHFKWRHLGQILFLPFFPTWIMSHFSSPLMHSYCPSRTKVLRKNPWKMSPRQSFINQDTY